MTTTPVARFVLSIVLDSSEFKKEQAGVGSLIDGFRRKLKDSGDATESDHRAHGDALRKLAIEAAKFYALLAGASSIKAFVSNLTTADAAIGRLSARLGQAPQELAAFGMAVERSGGNSGAALQSFEAFSDAIQEWRTTGSTAIIDTLSKISGAGGKVIDVYADTRTQILGISANLAAIAKTNPAKASWLGKQAGFDPDTVSMLMHGPAQVAALWDAARKYGPTGADTQAAQQYKEAITGLSQAATSLGRAVVTSYGPAITSIIERVKEWLAANKEWLTSEISARVEAFAKAVASFDWEGLRVGMAQFIGDASALADKLGGAKTVAIALFALWAGSGLLKMIAAFALLRAALGAVGIGGASAATLGRASMVMGTGAAIPLGGYRGRGAMGGSGDTRGGVYARGRRGTARRMGAGDGDGAASLKEANGLTVKPGAGQGHEGVMAFARMMEGEGIVNRFTAFRDKFHVGRPGSLHNRGLAGDFSLKDPRGSAAANAKMRATMKAAGLSDSDIQLIDEYARPSAGATGGHMHFAFRTEAAAAKFAAWAASRKGRTTRTTGKGPTEAPSGESEVPSIENRSSFMGFARGNLSKPTTTAPPPGAGVTMNPEAPGRPQINNKRAEFGNVTVHSQASDAQGIARDIRAHLKMRTDAALA